MKILFLLFVLFPYCNISAQEIITPTLLNVGQNAPNWELKNSDGEYKKLSDYTGRTILLDFWASWCAPCIRAQPMLQDIHQSFKNVVVLGVNINDIEGIDLSEYKNRYKLNYELLEGSKKMAKDYKIELLPIVYLISGDGKILYSGTGYNERKRAEIIEVIERNRK